MSLASLEFGLALFSAFSMGDLSLGFSPFISLLAFSFVASAAAWVFLSSIGFLSLFLLASRMAENNSSELWSSVCRLSLFGFASRMAESKSSVVWKAGRLLSSDAFAPLLDALDWSESIAFASVEFDPVVAGDFLSSDGALPDDGAGLATGVLADPLRPMQ